jgi:hypothetical protein
VEVTGAYGFRAIPLLENLYEFIGAIEAVRQPVVAMINYNH